MSEDLSNLTRTELIARVLGSEAECARKTYEATKEAANQTEFMRLTLDVTLILLKEIKILQAKLDPDIRCTKCGSIETEIVERNPNFHCLHRFCRDCGHHWFSEDPNHPRSIDQKSTIPSLKRCI